MIIKPAYGYVINQQLIGLPATFTSLGDVISSLLPMIVTLAGLACFAFMIMGGLKWITSSGDAKAIAEAQHTITNAVIGLIIVFVSWWLMIILETVLGIDVTGFGS